MRPSWFSDRNEKHKIGRGRCYLEFPIGPKNINFEEDVEILLSVKFHWITFSSFRGEVENVKS